MEDFNRDNIISEIMDKEEQTLDNYSPYNKELYLANMYEILNNLPTENLLRLAKTSIN